MKHLFFFVLTFLFAFLGYYLGDLLGGIYIAFPFSFIGIWVTFKIYDGMYPQPANLSAGEIKAFFFSKIFWAAFLNFLFIMLRGLFHVEITPEVGKEIINLDWTNIGQAALSVLIIVLRKTDIIKKIL
jgi:hypothetical protein